MANRYHTARGAALVMSLVWAVGATGALAASSKQKFPTLARVEQAVNEQFASLPDYEDGDLIVRSQVTPLFAKLKSLGWKVADRKRIERDLLGDESLLAKMLLARDGRGLMRDCRGMEHAFDRLDRLARMNDGERILQSLIDGPDGYKMLEYMTNTPGGTELGIMLGEAPKGENFNRPTGRIYTKRQLMARLQKSYARASQPETKPAQAKTKKAR